MPRSVWWLLCVGGAVSLIRCQPGDSTTQEAICEPSGHWSAQEQRRGGDCAPDRVSEEAIELHVMELEMTEEGSLWTVEVSRDGRNLESCSGVPSDDRCRFEVTCRSGVDERAFDLALSFELTETGIFSGSHVLTVAPRADDECRAEFTLDGERVSPLETSRKGP